MATSTESFGAVPVKLSRGTIRRMEKTQGNKRRALIFLCPDRDTNTYATTTTTAIPLETCWLLGQQEKQYVHHRQHGGNYQRQQSCNSNSRLPTLSTETTTTKSGEFASTGCDDVSDTVRRLKSEVLPSRVTVRQFPSHVFRESSLILLILLSIFSTYLIRPGNGLHPPQCQWSLYQDIERLNCVVESGSSLFVEEEVHGIGPEHAKSLWVQCNSSTYNDTSGGSGSINSNNNNEAGGIVLSYGIINKLQNVRDIRLENCKIDDITPLSHLRLQNLTIRAHTSLTSLEIKTLPDLRHLDLSTTSLTLPNDFLCFLPQTLEHLNLTSCFLRDIRAIFLSDPLNPNNCRTSIKVLDLSANHFTLLPPATFAAVTKLEELRIERNAITIAAERALLGLTSLKIISLAGNQLTSLSPEFFKDTPDLQQIYLNNNALSVLGPGLFGRLKHLAILDMSYNQLTSEWVNGDTFSGLHNLFALNLANNKLTKVDSVLFRGMPNLYTLILSHNHIKTIDNICFGLNGVSFLSVDNNEIDQVDPDSFKNCSGVQDMNLSGNKLTQVPQALSVLSHLRTLDLGENNITDVGNASYQSLANLYGLRLTDNSINFIPKDAFTNLPSLKIVNLAKNKIASIEQGTFDNPNLQAIRLDHNQLTDVAGLFKNIPNLLWLNISGNELQELNYHDYPPQLQWLHVRKNKIHNLGSCMDLDLRLRNLDISENYITELGGNNVPDNVEYFNVANNRINQIQPYTFYRKSKLTMVDISHNQLIHVEDTALRVTGTPEILLGHNPLQCDCGMEWLQHMNSDETSGQYPIIQDVADVKCTLSFDRLFQPISYLAIQSSQFLCSYKDHCFKTCQCCEYDACDCQRICPKNCSCYHDQAWSTNLVDCSMLEQNFIPERIPMDVTKLYLDGNYLKEINSHVFIGKKNLRYLYLNNSGIEKIQRNGFSNSGLAQLTVLHLDHNMLAQLEGYEFEDLENLEEIYLHDNRISFIANQTFSSLHRLRILWLHNNNMVDLPIWQMTTHIGRLGYTLMDLTLRGNEFSCQCQYATYLKDWLIENRAKISDASQVQCVDQVSSSTSSASSSSSHSSNNAGSNSQNQHASSSTSGGGSDSGKVTSGQQNRSQTELVVVRLLDQKNHQCTSSSSQSTDLSILEPTTSTESDEFNLGEYIPWLVCIIGVLLLLILLSVLSYYWRQSLRIWFHSRCGLRLGGEPPAERDKLFDAFVSYSSVATDEAWVRQVLAAELERNHPPYRLCLRYRDLPTGGTYLADTIVQASEASRRTILVLSHHFLKGEWSRTDVKSAHHSVLKDRHRKVIIILLGDLPIKDLDPDFRVYIKNHTFLNFNDKRFWDKLRYALPDVKVKAPVFGRTSSSQHRAPSGPTVGRPPSGPSLQPQNHHHPSAHHHYNQPSPNMSQAHHLTHLGPNTHNNITSPLMGPPPPLTAPPVPGLLANLPPNIPNGTIGPTGHHLHHGLLHGGGPVTTVIGTGIHGGSTASISTSSNNSGSQRAPQRHHPGLVSSAHHQSNSRQNTAINI